MDAISLIVRGDHFGLSHAANQAIEEAFETGILTCASLVVVSPWIAEAVRLIRAHPTWEVGLELILRSAPGGCSWAPAAGPQSIPTLLDATGSLPSVFSTTVDHGDLIRECEAQLERARAWGMTPAFLECPDVNDPRVFEVSQLLSQRTGIPAHMLNWNIQPLALPGSTTSSPASLLADTLQAMTGGTYLWTTQPATEAPETWGMWGEEIARIQQADLAALCDSAVRSAIGKRGIQLISFRQYLESRGQWAVKCRQKALGSR